MELVFLRCVSWFDSVVVVVGDWWCELSLNSCMVGDWWCELSLTVQDWWFELSLTVQDWWCELSLTVGDWWCVLSFTVGDWWCELSFNICTVANTLQGQMSIIVDTILRLTEIQI